MLEEGVLGSSFLFTSKVALTNASSSAITFPFSLGGGTAAAGDFGTPSFSNGVTFAAGVITIPAGVTSFTVTVPTTNDTTDEPDEAQRRADQAIAVWKDDLQVPRYLHLVSTAQIALYRGDAAGATLQPLPGAIQAPVAALAASFAPRGQVAEVARHGADERIPEWRDQPQQRVRLEQAVRVAQHHDLGVPGFETRVERRVLPHPLEGEQRHGGRSGVRGHDPVGAIVGAVGDDEDAQAIPRIAHGLEIGELGSDHRRLVVDHDHEIDTRQGAVSARSRKRPQAAQQ